MEHILNEQGIKLERISVGDYLIFEKGRSELVSEVYLEDCEVCTERLTPNDKRMAHMLPYINVCSGYKIGPEGIKAHRKRDWDITISVDLADFSNMQQENSGLLRTLPNSVLEVAK